MQAFTQNIVFDRGVRLLCIRPYTNHPKGCPNYFKKKGCPPRQKYLSEVFDTARGFWIVWVDFDFAAHCERMRRNHPNWSQRQIECCLYWQGRANKLLKKEIRDMAHYLRDRGNWKVTTCPEAMGVNVTETMKNIGVTLEWPPKNIVRKVALFGVVKDGKSD